MSTYLCAPETGATTGGVHPPPSADDQRLWDLWMTPYFFPSLLVADRIGRFSQLERGPSTREEVAVLAQS